MRYREHRYPSDRLVRIAHGPDVEPAELANISATGARVKGPASLAPGQRVSLCQRDIQIQAEVVWSDGRQTGMVFLKRLSPAELQAVSGTLGRPSGPGGRWDNHGFRELE
ncbi:hypothetical protein OCH239_05210 [Roseivivax halodurans JCM 10272]|uniref:PilZ domain-containing protein n=1 Tax=Roseivivax halodurans JCM 10272 TaxID=1449350 RepID=X7ED81_9RHOB|nr:PilZ domain-containing protein [Roseivivax halodurans]ETX14039.1 hypothetical protein OCH239_05210 [Roseivivax halodurans JCM 10272]